MKLQAEGWPCGPVVKFTYSALVAQGFPSSDPGCGPSTAHQSMLRGRPSGAAVKCARSASVAQGLLVRIPGGDMAPLGTPCCGRHPTYKVEEDGHNVSSGPVFLSKKEEDGNS